MKHVVLDLTTNISGAATTNGTMSILGKLYAILYSPGTIDTGATVTVTSQGVTARTLLVKASAGTSDLMFYPRDLVHKTEDGAALTGSSGGDRALPLICGTPRAVIASGGATATGKVILYYED